MALLLLVAATLLGRSERADAAATTSSSGLVGGGFMSIVAPDPFKPGHVLGGTDVMGIFRSTDYGLSWTPVNRAFDDVGGAASIVYSKKTGPGPDDYWVYAAMGPPDGGGFYHSADGGATWTLASPDPSYNAGNWDYIDVQGRTIRMGHPRSSGRLIAVSQVLNQQPTAIYTATFDEGILRSTNNGATWTLVDDPATPFQDTQVDELGQPLLWRSLVIDPKNSKLLYASAFRLEAPSVYKIDMTVSSSPKVTLLGVAPPRIEELTTVSTAGRKTLYGVGAAGVFRYDLDAGTGWLPVPGLLDGNWYTVTANAGSNPNDPATDVIYVGSFAPKQGTTDPSVYRTLMRYQNGTWESLPDQRSDISPNINGGSTPWWLSQSMPNWTWGSGFEVSSIAKDSGGRLYIAAAGGIYRSSDGGGSWAPFVAGLAITFNKAVAVDPDPAGSNKVYIANTDWAFLYSTTYGSSVTKKTHRDMAGVGHAMVADSFGGETSVYLSVGDRDSNSGGRVWTIANPTVGSSTWTSLGPADGSTGRRAFGLGVAHDGSCTVLLAAVDKKDAPGTPDSLFWRTIGNGCQPQQWTAIPYASHSVVAKSPIVFVSSNTALVGDNSGILRLSRSDSGLWSVTRLVAAYPHAVGCPGTATPNATPFLIPDPNDAQTVYSVAGRAVWRLTNVLSVPVFERLGGCGSTGSGLSLASSGRSPIAVHSGEIFAAAPVSDSAAQKIMKRSLSSGTWCQISDPKFGDYLGLAHALAVGDDDHIYVAMEGNGVLVLSGTTQC